MNERPDPAAARPPVVGLVLAGGRASRMGGTDKCLLTLAGRPILAHLVERLRPQVRRIVLNANGDLARFSAFGLPVVGDAVAGYAGPLAGVLAGLEWAAAKAPDCPWVLSAPGDGPFLPRDLVTRLQGEAQAGAEIVSVSSAGNRNPVIALWPVSLAPALRRALVEEKLSKVDAFEQRYRLALVDWPDRPVDPFFNANSPEELAEAERLLPLAP
ncbi:MAG TPA: molybdenum cofactor guanylyltransferase MobA [Kiloniellales bacterium]|nr:molybdenum cofactor guanylyltransferase MobA [Kiloniellales bacterium]